eukprot:gb/GECH01014774.1/.p1 GENE.gb/GECH01014774.1/~~gb/GECH01014774.1/.p1  ORF type:complete len:134 (+),score=13.13 gb/GECH01014774.1/:1-402(+)
MSSIFKKFQSSFVLCIFATFLFLLPNFCYSQVNFCTVDKCSQCLDHPECIWCQGTEHPYCLDKGQQCTAGHKTLTDPEKCSEPEQPVVSIVLGSIAFSAFVLAAVIGVTYYLYNRKRSETVNEPVYTHLPTDE